MLTHQNLTYNDSKTNINKKKHYGTDKTRKTRIQRNDENP